MVGVGFSFPLPTQNIIYRGVVRNNWLERIKALPS